MYRLTAPFDPKMHEVIRRVSATENLTMGNEVAAFEEELADVVGAKHAIMVNSGSSANLAMVAVSVFEGILNRTDPVAVSALAWPTTYSPYAFFGIPLRVFDVDKTYCMTDVDTTGCQAVMAVHALGNPATVDYDIPVLEDACEAFGSKNSDGKFCGTSGLMGSYSFYYSHHTHTFEGGAVVTDSDELAKRLIQIRAHGWTRGSGGDPAAFEFEFPGMNIRPMEIQGALGRYQLTVFDEHKAIRQANAQNYIHVTDQQYFKPDLNAIAFGFPFFAIMKGREAMLNHFRKDSIEAREIIGGNILLHKVAPYLNIESRLSGQPFVDRLHKYGFMTGNPPVLVERSIFRRIEDYIRDRGSNETTTRLHRGQKQQSDCADAYRAD